MKRYYYYPDRNLVYIAKPDLFLWSLQDKEISELVFTTLKQSVSNLRIDDIS